MSKLYNIYLELKKKDKNTIYLFKSGIFFIAINDDAYLLSKIFNFKITNLNNIAVKCSFPCSSLDKYSNLFKLYNLNVEIIDLDKNYIHKKAYKQNNKIEELLNIINSIDANNLSISEAYKFIENIKNRVDEIIKEN